MHEEEIVYDLMRERDKLRAEVERLRAEAAAAKAATDGELSAYRKEVERLRVELGGSVSLTQKLDAYSEDLEKRLRVTQRALFQAQEAAKGLAIELERLRTGLGKKRGGE